jgi:hypothetical protein
VGGTKRASIQVPDGSRYLIFLPVLRVLPADRTVHSYSLCNNQARKLTAYMKSLHYQVSLCSCSREKAPMVSWTTTIVSAISRRYPREVFHSITTISTEELVDSCHEEVRHPAHSQHQGRSSKYQLHQHHNTIDPYQWRQQR